MGKTMKKKEEKKKKKKDATYDNIKSHKKTGLHPLSRRYIFGKTTGEGHIGPRPSSLLRVKELSLKQIKLIFLEGESPTL